MLDGVGEFDEEGCAERLGVKHTASWLARELRVSEATAFEYVFVDREGRKYRVLYGAFEYGAVSYTTVRFLLRFARLYPFTFSADAPSQRLGSRRGNERG